MTLHKTLRVEGALSVLCKVTVAVMCLHGVYPQHTARDAWDFVDEGLESEDVVDSDSESEGEVITYPRI